MQSFILDKDIALISGRDGYFLINRNDVYVGKAIEIYGEYNSLEAEIFPFLLNPGDIVIEAGANIGSHTVGIAKRVGESGKVFAFEPQRACYSLLVAQLALNQLDNVHAYNEGLGAVDSIMSLPKTDYRQKGNFGGISLEAANTDAHEKVHVRRLDDLFVNLPVKLIKIDVEGMEKQVLEGARNLINNKKPILYVENDRVEKSSALIEYLLEMGYRLWWHIPPLFNPNNFFAVSDNIYGDVASFNMLCIHSSLETNLQGFREILSASEPHPLAR